MARKSSPFFNRSTPSLIEGALQNCFSTTRADCFSLRWSHSFVSITYQEASDMISSRTSTARAMISPVAQRAARPYGLSVVTVGWFSIVFLEAKKAAPDSTASGSFGHLEADAEIDAVVDGFAVLAARDVTTGLRQVERALIQPRAAGALRDRRRSRQFAAGPDADMHGRCALLVQALGGRGVEVFRVREVLGRRGALARGGMHTRRWSVRGGGHGRDGGGLRRFHRQVNGDVRRRHFHRGLLELRRRWRRRFLFGLDLLHDVGLDRRRDRFDRLVREPGGDRPGDEHVQADDGQEHRATARHELGIAYVDSHELLIVTLSEHTRSW